MRWVGYLNFFGVVALAVLLAIQWQRNTRLNLLAIDLDKTRQEQLRKIADEETTVKNTTADLDDFRNRLQLAEESLKKDEGEIDAVHKQRETALAERKVAVTERDEAKAALTQWETAVKTRDEAIKKEAAQLQKLELERDCAVAKYNDLAGKYNALVKDLDEARAKLAGKH